MITNSISLPLNLNSDNSNDNFYNIAEHFLRVLTVYNVANNSIDILDSTNSQVIETLQINEYAKISYIKTGITTYELKIFKFPENFYKSFVMSDIAENFTISADTDTDIFSITTPSTIRITLPKISDLPNSKRIFEFIDFAGNSSRNPINFACNTGDSFNKDGSPSTHTLNTNYGSIKLISRRINANGIGKWLIL